MKRSLVALLAPFAAAGLGWLFQRAGIKVMLDAIRRKGCCFHGVAAICMSAQGSGPSAVIFEAGLAASSLSWARVQPLVGRVQPAPLAMIARDWVEYSRSGRGRSLEQMLDDLHAW